MSVTSLQTQICEDHLTCAICCGNFVRPKALPCLHTFCEGCLRDYVAGRGYEHDGIFPCPVCRCNTFLPNTGIDGFTDNHLTSSLSHSAMRPVPKPRRSLGQPQIPEKSFARDNMEVEASEKQPEAGASFPEFSTLPSAPPPYSSVADTKPDNGDTDEATWAVVARQQPAAGISGVDAGTSVEYCVVSVSYPGSTQSSVTHPSNIVSKSSEPHSTPTHNDQITHPPVIGWNLSLNAADNVHSNLSYPTALTHMNDGRTLSTHTPREQVFPGDLQRTGASSPLYPSVPVESTSTACTENLLLKFGKQGSSVRDFLKPVGLTISREGHYIISDNGGDENKIFIYNSGGELTTAFRTGGKVKDITMTRSNEILAAVQKTTAAIRHFTMAGQCRAEYGKFFAYEVPCGIAMLSTGGAVLTGTQNNCVYILTDQMKLATKFGRKGNGDGYFLQPAHVTVDSKNQIIVTDKLNSNVQVFNPDGKFKCRFNTTNVKSQLSAPLGVCIDNKDNIVVADSGNYRVEVFSASGQWLSTVVKDTHMLGENVRPVNVAVTPTGKVAVLLRGPYFAEVRVYTSHHQQILQLENDGSVSKSVWYSN